MSIFFFFLLVCPTLTLRTQEVDGLVKVKQFINLLRIKSHIKSWIEDPGLNYLGRNLVMHLLAHHAADVNTLASTLTSHLHLESFYLDLPEVPVQGVARVKRNILGNLFSAVSGMPTGEQFEHQTHVQEELREKLTNLLRLESEAEKQASKAFSSIAKEEEQLELRISAAEQKADELGRAIGRMFLYLELLEEDSDLLEDTLEGLRTGLAPPRLDTYLSRLAGLKSMAVFALESVEKSAVGSGVTATYLSRVYRDVEVLSQELVFNQSVISLRTEDRQYLITAGEVPVLSEHKVLYLFIFLDLSIECFFSGPLFWRRL